MQVSNELQRGQRGRLQWVLSLSDCALIYKHFMLHPAYYYSMYTDNLLMLLWVCVWLQILSSPCLNPYVCIFYFTIEYKDIDWLTEWSFHLGFVFIFQRKEKKKKRRRKKWDNTSLHKDKDSSTSWIFFLPICRWRQTRLHTIRQTRIQIIAANYRIHLKNKKQTNYYCLNLCKIREKREKNSKEKAIKSRLCSKRVSSLTRRKKRELC